MKTQTPATTPNTSRARLCGLNATQAIDKLEEFQRQIVHGSNVFGDIADVIRRLKQFAERVEPHAANKWCNDKTDDGRAIYDACFDVRDIL